MTIDVLTRDPKPEDQTTELRVDFGWDPIAEGLGGFRGPAETIRLTQKEWDCGDRVHVARWKSGFTIFRQRVVYTPVVWFRRGEWGKLEEISTPIMVDPNYPSPEPEPSDVEKAGLEYNTMKFQVETITGRGCSWWFTADSERVTANIRMFPDMVTVASGEGPPGDFPFAVMMAMDDWDRERTPEENESLI